MSDKNTTQTRFLSHIYSPADTHTDVAAAVYSSASDSSSSWLIWKYRSSYVSLSEATTLSQSRRLFFFRYFFVRYFRYLWKNTDHQNRFQEGSLVLVVLVTLLVLPFGELLLRRHVDLVLHAADLDDVTQIPRLPVHLDLLFKEGLLLDRA